MKATTTLCLALALAGLAACTKDPLKSFPPEISSIKTSLESTFEALETQMNVATTHLATIIGDTTQERLELKRLFSDSPEFVLDYALVSPAGILEIIEPPAYYPSEGSDISGQAHFNKLFSEKTPVLSATFLAVEGFYAAVDGHPVIKNNQVSGALTALFFPHQLLDPIIDPLILNQDFEIWMMEKGGTLIWDQDIPDIGRNLFTDPYYDPFPNLKIALEKIVAEEYGETTYSFFQAGTSIEVVKRAHWVTFSHHGQEWKIVHVIIE
jgi:hypothetical protein